MTNRLPRSIAALSLFLFNGLSFADQTSTLSLYIWEDSLAPSVVTQWHQQHASTINQTYFDNDDERNTLLLNSAKLPFDIITLDNVSAQIYGKQGALVDVSTLPNRRNNQPRFNRACGDHAIPYFWGTLGLSYRKSQFPTPPTSWRAITHPADQHKGHIAMLPDTIETLLPALKTLGYRSDTADKGELKQAYQHVLAQLSDFLTFEYGFSYAKSHPNSTDMHIAMTYSGDQYALNNVYNDDDWAFAVPEEGTSIWVDCVAINKSSDNIEEAKQFLNYLMEPEIAAMNANVVRVATPNKAALNQLDESYKNDVSLFPPQSLIDISEIDSQLSQSNVTLRNKIIKTIVSQYESQR